MSEETEEIENEIIKYIYNVVGMSYNTKKALELKLKLEEKIKEEKENERISEEVNKKVYNKKRKQNI